MIVSCPRCRRANPGEAQFCYFDGMSLGRASGGPLQAGTVPFPMPFIFPGGLSCANFNQFAMGCQKNWDVARDYLKQGHWVRFMQGIGRLDLAKAAEQAQTETDPDQGLDRFMSKIPSEVMQSPKLVVEPTLINLGQLKPGVDHKFQVTVSNHGMRLLRGSIRVEGDWITLGDGAGAPEIFFQTPTESVIHVRVVGKHFRAEAKAKRATLNILTNGGEEAVVINAEAPIVAFPEGILQGATTPREIAVRAKKNPKLAAPLFESGAVEAWYKANGWEYPVQGPAGSGLGAIQQFFEALGLVKAPVVTIDQTAVQLSAPAGESCNFVLHVRSAEQKPVFAHAHSNQPWLTPNAPVFSGNRVTLPVSVPVVPDAAGQSLKAQLTVRANGNQKFVVPVTVDVKPGKKPAAATFEPVVDTAVMAGSPPMSVSAAAKSEGAAFGMKRLVYWSAILGAWSAFLGWLVAELSVFHWPLSGWLGGDKWVIAMAMLVGGAMGSGLSVLSALVGGQWHGQLRKIGIGFVGGAAAGFVGVMLGNYLYSLFGHSNPMLDFAARVIGWTLMGMAIGAWEGIFQLDLVKLRNGLIGGCLGGCIGGILFNPLAQLVRGEMSSRAISFVVLGLCVGLLIGLVQVLLKDGWLTVIEGFRPGRQLILSRSVTTLGTSEKSNLIFIAYGSKGVEPIHAAVERTAAGTFVVSDQQSRTGTLVNGETIRDARPLRDGDVIQLGVNKVRFNERVRSHEAVGEGSKP